MAKNINSFIANGTIKLISINPNIALDIHKLKDFIKAVRTTRQSKQSN